MTAQWIRLPLVLALVRSVLCVSSVSSLSPSDGPPNFVAEPPARVDFFHTTPRVVECVVSGNARVSWVRLDSDHNWTSVTNSSSGLRFIRPEDNALVLSAFSAQDLDPHIHQTIYRCLATNRWGTVASRNVFVRAAQHYTSLSLPVLFDSYQLNVYDEYVIRGSIAVFRCQMPAFVKPYLRINSWIRDDGFVINNALKTGLKYQTIDGDLYVHGITAADGHSGHSYKCSATNTVTGTEHLSASAGKLIVTDPSAPIPPRIRVAHKEVTVNEGQDAHLVCVAQAFPPVSYRWIRNSETVESAPIVRLTRVSSQMSGLYTCLANNSVGRDQFETRLVVKEPLKAVLSVGADRLQVGEEVRLNCSISGSPVTSVNWAKNGFPLAVDHRIRVVGRVVVISSAQRQDIGCYSCRVNDDTESVVASKCLHLTEDAPRLRHAFRQHVLRPNERLSLRCVASGTPIPTIVWSVDSAPIVDSHRIQFGDYVSAAGDVISSYVNVSHVRQEDSGVYECMATNIAGSVSHRQTVAVLGAMFMREMANISAVDGQTLVVRCPVVQIDPKDPQIVWTKGVKEVSLLSERHKTYENGTLVVRDVNRESDTGMYTCSAVSRSGQSARRDVFIQVLKKPVLSTFAFPPALTSGMRVIVTCSVLEGDQPIALLWLKDGQRVDTQVLDIEEISMGDMGSSLLFRRVDRKHSGLYSCSARNSAGNTTFSAKMVVRVPPVWTILPPSEKSVVVAETVRFDCQADGFPLPVIRWKVKTGERSDFRPLSSNYHIQSLENGSLAIKDADKEDAGLYVCEAGNGVGNDVSLVVRLAVNIGAHFKKSFQVIRVLKGHTIRVICEAVGEKPLTVKWMRDRTDIDLIPDKKYTITERHTPDGLVSELMSPSAQRSDSAQFVCLAFNLFAQSEMTSQVVVEESPDAPIGLTVLDLKSRSVSLKWEQPFSGNNAISKYTVEWKADNEVWSAKSLRTEVVSKSETQAVITDLKPLTKYEVRVRAENGVGQSPWAEVRAKTEEEMPTNPPQDIKVLALSSKTLRISWKPPRERTAVKGYYIGYKALNSEKPTTYKTVEFTHNNDMEYVLTSLNTSHKYLITVQAFNNKGAGPQSEEVMAQTFAYDAPEAPQLRLLDSAEVTAANLSWTADSENPIRGFRVYGRRLGDDWQEYRALDGNARAFEITGLRCGSLYQFYSIAFNDIGVSPASEMVSKDLTRIGVGESPDKSAFLSVNVTQIDVHLSSWRSFGFCSVNYFRIQYKEVADNEWTLVSDSVSPQMPTLTISGLKAGFWYRLLVSAHNNADVVSDAEYLFATLTETGGTIAPLERLMTADTTDRRMNRYFIVFIPISCATAVLLVIGFVIVYICLRKTSSDHMIANQTNDCQMKRDSFSMTQINKKSECQTPVYSAHIPAHFPTPYATSRFIGPEVSSDQNAYDLPQPLLKSSARESNANQYQSLLMGHEFGQTLSSHFRRSADTSGEITCNERAADDTCVECNNGLALSARSHHCCRH